MKNLFYFLIFGLIMSSCSRELKTPNVLFIISDDLTATAVSSFDGFVCQTPNIDKLASEGIKFTSTYCQYPVCGPSRASLMSGYYPTATGTYGYVSGRKNIGPDRKMLPELFRENGYYTARVSKIFHMGIPIDIERGTDGTDDPACWVEKFNSQGPEWRAVGEAELVQGNPDGTIERKGGNVMTIVKADGDDLVHSDGKTAKKACELIRAHKDEPFFIAVGFVRPHVPFVAPKKYFKDYPFEDIVMPEVIEGDWDDIPKRGINYVTSVNGQMDEEDEKKAVAAYYAAVAYMDAQVGKVLNTLEEEGLSDKTIVVFTSDHGFHLGEHKFWMKVSLHEESVKIPLVIKVPGRKYAVGRRQSAVCSSFVELIDLYPTLAELAGLEYSEHLQGKSLVETLIEPNTQVRDMVFTVSQGGRTFGLRTDQYAYIQYDEDAGSGIELFDMVKDPKQYTNLAINPDYADLVTEFQNKLKDKLQEVRTNDLAH